MIDFQAAEMKSLEQPPSVVGLEVLCAMVCELCKHIICDSDIKHLSELLLPIILWQINNNLRCYDLASELSATTLEALPENYAEQVNMW